MAFWPRSYREIGMMEMLVRTSLAFAFVSLAACGAGDGGSPSTAAPEPKAEAVIESVQGATCAIAPAPEDRNTYRGASTLMECLNALALEDWAKASAEAEHIAAWELSWGPLRELTTGLSRYESSDAMRADLETRGLLGGPGSEHYEEFYPEDHVPITVNGWLEKSGYYLMFDAETGMWPNEHDAGLCEIRRRR